MSVLERESAFSEAAAQALFEEARQRTRRRRRRRWLAVAAAGIGLGALALAIVDARAGGASGVIAQTASRPFADPDAFSGHGDLAFISRGGLWVLDGASGRLQLVAPARDQPSGAQFSRDGRWLTFAAITPAGKSQLWVARADGTHRRRVPETSIGMSGFLPDGRLIAGGHLWQISASGGLSDTGRIPTDLVAWAPDGSAYAFVDSTRRNGRAGSWTESQRLELSLTLRGARTTWFTSHISFTTAGGINGGVLGGVVVLPKGKRILISPDPDGSASLSADGRTLFELTHPGGRPRALGTVVDAQVSVDSAGFALTRGPNRYAWVTKRVSVCTTRCVAIPTSPGELSLDPALSSRGALAYVQAASGGEGMIGQPQVHGWYATHRLLVLAPGASAPREVNGSAGAATPVWSADGHSLLYVADNALWLLPSLGSHPVRVAAPLFEANVWPSFYGQVDWQSQFAWSS